MKRPKLKFIAMRIQFVICILCLSPLLNVPLHSQTKANADLVKGRTDKRSQLEALKKTLRDNPHGPGDPNDLRIRIISLLLDVKAPFTEIREVVDIDSKYPNKSLFARVATLLADRKEYLDEALELIDRAISAPRIPNDAISYWKFEITRGYVYLQRREIDKAVDIFTSLQKQVPYDETLLTYLGLAYQRSGRIDDAINTYLQQSGLYYFTAPTSGGDDLRALYRQKFGSLDGLQQKIEQTWLAMRRKVYVENVMVNLPGPPWTLNNLAGEPVSLGDFKRKILILCFLPFVNAGDDLEKLKAIQKMYLHYKPREVAVVCISDERFLTGKQRTEVIQALREAEVTLPILTYEDKRVIQEYKTYEEPFVYLLDGQGNIRFKHSLYNREYQVPLQEQLRYLLENRNVKKVPSSW